MLKSKKIYYIIILQLLVLFSSCSSYKKLLKSSNNELKYEKAMEYYEKEQYAKAQELFSDLRIVFKGSSEKGENVMYYYAQCSYYLSEYEIASYLFKDFAKQYPASKKAEEALFLSAYCHYLRSPQASLDQTSTKEALDEFQLFLDRSPNSNRRQEAETLVDNLQKKLETKAYNNAYLYFTIGDYKAATIALQNVLLKYPDTKYREDILFTIIKAYYMYAENSIHSKQLERYKSTIQAYYNFIDNYPNSKKIKEAEKYYTNSQKFIDK